MAFKPVIFDGYNGDRIRSFTAMRKAGIQLCILKATQGVTYRDPSYDMFCDRAVEAGMLIGAYHFGVDADGVKQADAFLKRCRVGQLMVLDFERYKDPMTVSQAEAFLARVQQVTGKLPVIYYGEYLKSSVQAGLVGKKSLIWQCRGWVSQYGPKLVPIAGIDTVMWQYTGDGEGPMPHRVDGCDNDADLSVWVGNLADLPRFVSKYGYAVKA